MARSPRYHPILIVPVSRSTTPRGPEEALMEKLHANRFIASKPIRACVLWPYMCSRRRLAHGVSNSPF